MPEAFTYDAYSALLDRLARSHVNLRCVDVRQGFPPEPCFVLRHDVDYSPAAALRLAEFEAGRGRRATYFLLTNGAYYNLLDPRHAHLPRRLVALGHEVGLHYDARFLRAFPRQEWDGLLDAQAALLAALSGQPVTSIAMHQPALVGADPFARRADYLNAYGPRLCGEATYVSDSCQAWRDAAWDLLTRGPLPARLHLCLHPLNWTPEGRPRAQVFQGVLDEALEALARQHTELVELIAAHAGVREHDARLARAAGVVP